VKRHILIDGREFVADRRTGIGRFLEGLLLAIHVKHPSWCLVVAMFDVSALPKALFGKVETRALGKFPELYWSSLSQGFDLFLSPYPKLPWRKLSCPSIHTVHDVFYLTHPAYQGNALRRAAALWRLRQALHVSDLTWFDSRATQDECERLCVFNADTSKVRYPSVEQQFQPDDSVAVEPFFLFVGNGLPHKNVDVLLQAIQGTNFTLKCVGIHRDMAEKLLKRHHVNSAQVIFLQGVDDRKLLQLYQQATCLLQPSTAEGYGYPPLEAMCCGTPAIVSYIPVLRETTGASATYCPPHDAGAWQAAMKKMFDVQLRQTRANEGMLWAQAHQGAAGWAEHIADIEQLVSGDK